MIPPINDYKSYIENLKKATEYFDYNLILQTNKLLELIENIDKKYSGYTRTEFHVIAGLASLYNIVGSLLTALNQFYFAIVHKGPSIPIYEAWINQGLFHRTSPYTASEIYDTLINLSTGNREFVINKLTDDIKLYTRLVDDINNADRDGFVNTIHDNHCDVRNITDLCYTINAYDNTTIIHKDNSWDDYEKYVGTVEAYKIVSMDGMPNELKDSRKKDINEEVQLIGTLINSDNTNDKVRSLYFMLCKATDDVKSRLFSILGIEPYLYDNELDILWNMKAMQVEFIKEPIMEWKEEYYRLNQKTEEPELSESAVTNKQQMYGETYCNLFKNKLDKKKVLHSKLLEWVKQVYKDHIQDSWDWIIVIYICKKHHLMYNNYEEIKRDIIRLFPDVTPPKKLSLADSLMTLGRVDFKGQIILPSKEEWDRQCDEIYNTPGSGKNFSKKKCKDNYQVIVEVNKDFYINMYTESIN